MNSFHNDSLMFDYDYRLKVTKECYAFGIHLDDYMEYWPTNEGPVYIRKVPRNESVRSPTFYAIERNEMLLFQHSFFMSIFHLYIQVRYPEMFFHSNEAGRGVKFTL